MTSEKNYGGEVSASPIAEMIQARTSRCTKWPRQEDNASSCPRVVKKFAAVTTAPPAMGDPALSTTPSNDGALFLAACHVLLQDDHDPTCPSYPWLESTKSLSLVCLQLCVECRAASHFHVRVARDTPRSLWVVLPDGNRSSDYLTDLSLPSARVPAVKVTKITWDRVHPGEQQVSAATIALLPDVKELVFGDGYNQPVDTFMWPKGLERVRFGAFFNHPVDGVLFPSTVKEITFGKSFDQAIGRVVWPRELKRITFGRSFDQVIEVHSSGGWPPGVVELAFGHGFNQPINSVDWPPKLERLIFGHEFNQDISEVSWPATLKDLTLGWLFDHSLQSVALPESLEQLSLAGLFDRPLDGVVLPAGLKRLTLGGHFNQSVRSVALPESLEQLAFGWSYNHSFLHVRWPRNLKKITLGYRFKQSADCLRLPANLEALELGVFSRQSLADVVWPKSFKSLTVSRAFDLGGAMLPKGARVCRLGHTYCNVKRGVKHWYHHRIIV